MRINLLSSFGVLRAAAKAMMRPANGGGSIVFCSSAVAKHGIANHEAIAAAKVCIRGDGKSEGVASRRPALQVLPLPLLACS